jgi:hypothetical protein
LKVDLRAPVITASIDVLNITMCQYGTAPRGRGAGDGTAVSRKSANALAAVALR